MNTEAKAAVPADEFQLPSWSDLVERIRNADPAALEELHAILAKGVRYYLWRQVGPQDVDDRVHDIYLIVTQSIQRGELREPERLMGFVRTVARRLVANIIEGAVHSRRNQVDVSSRPDLSSGDLTPERQAIQQQNQELAMRVLGSLPKRDREVLMRFYLEEQSAEQICQEMSLTPTQFRLIKTRAKARYTELGQRRFAQRSGFRP